MAFWTRLRPGPVPGLNAYCYDFPARCRSLKWRRQHSVMLAMPDEPPRPTQRLAWQLCGYVERHDIFDRPLPF